MTVIAEWYNSDGCVHHTFQKVAGVEIPAGQEVHLSALDTVAAATDANTGIGVSLGDYAATYAGPMEVALFGRAIAPVIGNGTVTAGVAAVSAGNGKFTNAGATPDARTMRGIFLQTSAVDGDIVAMLVR